MKLIIQDYNKIFWGFVNNFDTENSNILRKIIHSFDVATNCFKIACKLGLCEKDRHFAYLVGLLHDVGRFEQWEEFQTYDDNKSVDHGDKSFEILSEWDYKKLYLSKKRFEVLKTCAKFHNKPYTANDKDCLLFVELIKNADTFSNIITTANGAQPILVNKDGVTEQIYQDFLDLKPLIWFTPITKLDRCLIRISGCYNLTYNFLREEVLNNNYIDIMFETFSQYLNKKDKQFFKDAVVDLKKKYIELL